MERDGAVKPEHAEIRFVSGPLEDARGQKEAFSCITRSLVCTWHVASVYELSCYR